MALDQHLKQTGGLRGNSKGVVSLDDDASMSVAKMMTVMILTQQHREVTLFVLTRN